MRKLLMTSAAAATLGAFLITSANAADLPAYTPPPPAPVWSWTGPYAGLHVGTIDGDVDGAFNLDDFNFDPNGIMGGLQAGYNFQFNSIVLGLEGDVSFGDVDDVIYPIDFRLESQMDWMGTIRARLGWTMDRTLFYATGGVAFTDLEIKFDAGGDFRQSKKNSYFGWTVGGGVEHALTNNISLKAEYLYTDFGKEEFNFFEDEVLGDVKLKAHTFRVGVNWLF